MQLPNIAGILLSIPHKPVTLEAVDQVSERARLAGACNVVCRNADGAIVGDLIDSKGFMRALDRASPDAPLHWPDVHALVMGAGGVGCAIAPSLSAPGVGALGIVDSRAASTDDLRARLPGDPGQLGHIPGTGLRHCRQCDAAGHGPGRCDAARPRRRRASRRRGRLCDEVGNDVAAAGCAAPRLPDTARPGNLQNRRRCTWNCLAGPAYPQLISARWACFSDGYSVTSTRPRQLPSF